MTYYGTGYYATPYYATPYYNTAEVDFQIHPVGTSKKRKLQQVREDNDMVLALIMAFLEIKD